MSVYLSVMPGPDDIEPDGTEDGRWPDAPDQDVAPQHWAAGDGQNPRSTHALFPGDRGELTLAARRALLALTKSRFISAESHPAEWQALLANEAAIEARLNDVFLLLVIDREREVAWKQQATPDGGGTFPTLLYSQSWSREATIAMVFLRQRQLHATRDMLEHTMVDREEILEAIDAARPASATDHVADRKRAEKAVDDLYTAGLLRGPKTAQRLRVARAIEALLPLDTLTALLEQIQAATGAAASDGDQP